MNKEIWKDVVGYEGFYKVSSLGRIKSLPRTWISGNGKLQSKPESIIKQFIVRGYYQVALTVNGITKQFKAHRLELIAFKPNLENKKMGNHKDGNKLNNHLDNLEWATPSENCKHAYDTNLKNPLIGSMHQNSKPVINLETGIYYDTLTEAAISKNINICTLSAMLTGRNPNRTSFKYCA